MAVNSKQKGARFERLLASKFREYGYDQARRTAQYCGNTGDASDVVGLPHIHVEAKHQERMQLYEWMAQAKRDAANGGKGNLPAVFHKKNNANILVTMELEDWMNLYREWEAGIETGCECGMKERAIYIGFSQHDCEAWYRCPCCAKNFGSWLVFRQEKNENGTNKYCPHCKEELSGLD